MCDKFKVTAVEGLKWRAHACCKRKKQKKEKKKKKKKFLMRDFSTRSGREICVERNDKNLDQS